MMREHSSELGSGMTGRIPILGAMATDRTWVSLPTRLRDDGVHLFPPKKSCAVFQVPGFGL